MLNKNSTNLIIKKIFMLSLMIFSISSGYSYTNVSSCTPISISGEYKLNQSIINHGDSDCISISNHNIHFNCQGLTIDGTQNLNSPYPAAIYVSQFLQNVSINNCVISDFYYGLEFNPSNSKLDNISIFNTTQAIYQRGESNFISNIKINLSYFSGFSFSNLDDSNFTNISVSNTTYAYYFNGNTFNSIFNNISSTFSDFGIYGTAPMFIGNIVNKSHITGRNNSIYMPSNFQNNIFSNSYFDNFSLVEITSGTIVNNTFTGNTYLDGTILDPACFIGTTICILNQQIIAQSTSKLLSTSTISIFISILLILGTLI